MKRQSLRSFTVVCAVGLLLRVIAAAAPGDLYEADGASGNIFRFTPGGSRSTFASVNGPRGLAFDKAGNLFVADTAGNSISKFTPAGAATIFASNLKGPWGLAFDSSGNLYEADFNSGTIFSFTPTGTKSTFATGLGNPRGLAFDSSGNLFVADVNGSVFKLTPAGAKSTFATGLSFPASLVCDSSDNLFEADSQSGKIFRFAPDGSKTTFASGLGICFGFAFDSAGNLFVTDKNTNTISKITPDGMKTTFASGLDTPYFLLFEPASNAQLLNISTRMRVLTGDNVLIGGFIITGTDPKKVIIRGMGPSLNGVGVTLSDPTLELHQGSTTVTTNDNWKIDDQTGQSQEADIRATTIPPANDLESAIVATLNPGAYTAILAGKNGGTGVGLVEVYDLAQAASSKLANISTRGFVDTGNNVMIGGLIVGGTAKVIVRALGPSVPVAGALGDPTLELHDGSGTTIATNDNWKINDQTGQSQQAEIEATTIPPTNDLESALVATLAPGNYTAIVGGKNNTTGVGLVEVYSLQ